MELKFYKISKWMFTLLGLFVLLSSGMAQTYTVGAATGVGNGATSYPASFPGWFGGNRQQYLYTVAQLSASGLPASALISKIGYNVINVNSCPTLNQYSVKMKLTASTSVTGTETGLTVVKLPYSVTPVVGWNDIVLDNNFTWDGSSNILIEICYNNANGGAGSGNATTEWFTSVGYNSNMRYNIDNSSDACTPALVSSTTNLPRIRFEASSAPCSGAPVGGTAAASIASVCPSATFSINVSGSSTGSGLTYQWQSSPDAIVWTNISGATSASYTSTLTAQTNFRRKIICTNGTDSAFSSAVTVGVSPFSSCYCSSAFTNANDEKITNVTIGTINNTTTGTVGGPVNYTAQTADVIAGNTHSLSVSYFADAGDYVRAYIDWNQNGVLNDAGEVYVIASGASAPGTQTIDIAVPTSAVLGNTRLRVMVANTSTTGPCISTVYGEAEDYTLNVLPPPANEAGITAITRPGISPCSLGNQIWVNLQNLGSDPLTQVNFAVNINGFNISTVANPWTGSVAPGQTLEVQVPVSYTLNDDDTISVTVSLPNGQVEDPVFAFNNQKGRRVFTSLSGIKTVGGSGNYANLDEALEDLYVRGVCDTVNFQVASGTYNTQHVLSPYTGAGPGKLVVIESASGNAADVVYSFANVSAANYVFRFDGGSYYTVRNLTLNSTGTTYAAVVDITNNAHHLEFDNNIFSSDTAMALTSGDFDRTLLSTSYDGGTDYDNLWIHDNQFIGGQRSIDLEIEDGDFQSNIVIENNSMSKYALLGLLTYNTQSLKITNNILTGRTVVGTTSGMQVINAFGGGKITGNKINMTAPGYGLLLSDIPGASSPLEFSNNFISGEDSSVAGVGSAIYVEEYGLLTGNIVIANNSISFRSKNTAHAAINVASGNSINIINNNVASFGAAPVLKSTNANSIESSSNNNFFGATLGNIGGSNYATLAALQGAGFGANSVSVNPGFNGSDLHTCAPALNGAGLPLAYITVDIDGDARGTTPDIGADEFAGDANNLLVADEFLKCPSEQVTIGNTAVSGVTYSWTPASGSASQITTANAGTYVVTATSSCGSFRDTATVVNKPLPTSSFTSVSVGLAAIFTNTSTNGTSYLWNFGDGNSSTDANPTHVYSLASSYSVSLTVTNECGSAIFGPTPVNVINAGIEENTLMEVSLFPNPTSGTFNVTFSGVNGGETTISVIDVTGKTILVKNIAAGVNQVTLDATTFASGIYSVKVSNGEFTKVIRMVRK